MHAQPNMTAAQLERAPIWSRIILRSGLATHCGLHAGDVAVLLCLADHANSEGLAWPKQTTIMHETGLSKRGVRNASKRIAALGIVRRRKRFKLYEYMLPDEADIERLIARSVPDIEAQSASVQPSGARSVPDIEAQSAPVQPSGARSVPDIEAQSAPDRGTECPRPEARSAPQKVTDRSCQREDPRSEGFGSSLTDGLRAEAEVPEGGEQTAGDLWSAVQREFALGLPRVAYETWVRDTAGVAVEEGRFVVEAPHVYARDWLRSRLRARIVKSVSRLRGRDVEVAFIVRGQPASAAVATPAH